MDKSLKSRIHAQIDDSTIPQELKVVYLLASALQLMIGDSHRRIVSVFRQHGVEANENSLLSGLNDYCKQVKRASWQFFAKVEPVISDATFQVFADREGVEEAARKYDQFSDDAYEVARLLLLYVDRTCRNHDAFAKVFKTLRQLPSTGLFRDEDFSRFKQK